MSNVDSVLPTKINKNPVLCLQKVLIDSENTHGPSIVIYIEFIQLTISFGMSLSNITS